MRNYIKAIFSLLKEANKEVKYIASYLFGFVFIYAAIFTKQIIFCLVAVLWTLMVSIVIIIKETSIIEKIKKRKQELDEREE